MKKLVVCLLIALSSTLAWAQEQDPEWLVLVKRVGQFRSHGLYEEALQVATEALGEAEKSDDIRAVGVALNSQALLQMDLGDFHNAAQGFARAQEIYVENFGPKHEWTAKIYKNHSLCLTSLARYDEAETLVRRALDVYLEMDVARNQWQTLELMAELAAVLTEQNRLEEAQELYAEAISKLDPGPHLAAAKSSYATLLGKLGDTDTAERLTAEVVDFWQQAPQPQNQRALSGALRSRARQFYNQMQFAQAESLYQKSLELYDAALPGHPGRARHLFDLGLLYSEMRDYEKAEEMLSRSVATHEKWVGPDHPQTATNLSALASVYSEAGKAEEAEQLYRRSLAINEKVYPKDHPEIATDLNNLAIHLLRAKRPQEALPLIERAVAIRRASPNTAELATTLGNLGVAYQDLGKLKQARASFEEALKLGDAQTRATIYNNLSYLAIDEGDRETALGYAHKASEALFARLQEIFSFTSERQRLAFNRGLVPYGLFATLERPQELLRTALRFKGVVLDSIAEDYRLAQATNNPELKEKVRQLQLTKKELMKLSLQKKTPAIEKRQTELQQRLENGQAELARQVKGLSQGRLAFRITPAQVQKALPEGAVLVEFLYHGYYFGNDKSEKRYGAVLLPWQGEPLWVELGEAKSIESMVRRYRRVVRRGGAGSRASRPTQEKVVVSQGEQQLQQAYEVLWQPVQQLLPQGSKRLIISPDGDLNFVSFTTLVDPQGKFLGESYDISYVSSGRDLVAETEDTELAAPFLLGAPDYRRPDSQRDEKRRYLVTLDPLPGSAKECQTLEAVLKDKGYQPKLVVADQAVETRLLELRSPEVLHLATHGFFLGSRFGENPMVRSGLALYGAESTLDAWQDGQVPEPHSDGVLTAQEVTGLHLENTKVVVLSACDTGLGEAQKGEGVMGLRRGFVQAGCRNLVFTLWPVADQETSEFMVDFYALLKDQGPVQSLNTTQRAWLTKLREQHGTLAAATLAGPFVITSRH